MEGFFDNHKVFFPLMFGALDLSISDFALSIVLLPGILYVFLMLCLFKPSYRPGTFQNIAEFLYEKAESVFKPHLGHAGWKYIPFLFCLMFFIFIVNIGNLIPGIFACTSQITVTMNLAIMVFFLVCLIGLYEHGSGFWSFFIPAGIPSILKPVLFVLELFSFCIRPFSLGLRLCINMVAGHMILNVISTFSQKMGVFAGGAMLISVVLTCFEIGVAALQAYVFAVLSSIYIGDILKGHGDPVHRT